MECYCTNCKRETEIIIVRSITNNKTKEKKLRGYCKVCCESMCLIFFG